MRAGLIALLVLAGCAKPQYQTFTLYDPPEGPKALKAFAPCLQTLEREQETCRQGADMRAMQCETRAELAHLRCETAAEKKHLECKKDPNAFCIQMPCYKDPCRPDYSACTRTYNIGYGACGGKVSSETRCVAHCDKIPK